MGGGLVLALFLNNNYAFKISEILPVHTSNFQYRFLEILSILLSVRIPLCIFVYEEGKKHSFDLTQNLFSTHENYKEKVYNGTIRRNKIKLSKEKVKEKF
jgi:hypothetical protein